MCCPHSRDEETARGEDISWDLTFFFFLRWADSAQMTGTCTPGKQLTEFFVFASLSLIKVQNSLTILVTEIC